MPLDVPLLRRFSAVALTFRPIHETLYRFWDKGKSAPGLGRFPSRPAEGGCDFMQFNLECLARACRVFCALAYPDGGETIPVKRRIYASLPLDRPLSDFLPPAIPGDVCQAIAAPEGHVNGYAFRLGSAGFPHLKLKVQQVDGANGNAWVFMVDTHDAFSKESVQAPANHPDAAAWSALQQANRRLKEQIEQALEGEGLTTFNSLLRSELEPNRTR